MSRPPAPVPLSRASGAPVTPVAWRQRGTPGPVERARLRARFGAVLRRERAAHRLTQRGLAALVGCDRRTVERLECGQLRPTTALVAALAQALAIPPGWSPAGRSEAVEQLGAQLAAAAGPSLVESTPGGARRRRRRLRKARLAADHVAVPMLLARRGLPPVGQATREVPADVAAAVRSYR